MRNEARRVMTDLELGVIQPFQVADQLRLEGVPSFEIKDMTDEIIETYRKMHPCY